MTGYAPEERVVSDAFNSSPAKVGSLLATNSLERERLVVPIFQRGYMWKKKHVDDFWQDVDKQRIRSRVKGADPHFFGPIVTRSSPADGVIWLLDGQQRIATTAILFSVLRDVGREISAITGTQTGADFAANLHSQYICNEDGQYSIQLGETDDIFFRSTIQTDPPTASRPKQITHRNIKAARDNLYDKVLSVVGTIHASMDSIQAVRTLKELKQTLVSDLITARIPVNSQEAAFKIFATLNDRGLRLSPPDLLLSFLMESAQEHERRDIRNVWTQMIQKMGTHDIHDFLRAMWISRHGDLKKEDLFTALKRHVEDSRINPADFAKECSDECDDYFYLATADDSQLPKDSVRFIRAITRELTLRSAFPLLLSSYLVMTPQDFCEIAKYILVFITRYSIIGYRESSGMEDLLFKLAREVRTMVTPALDKFASSKARVHVKTVLAAEAPNDEIFRTAVLSATPDPSEAKYVMTRVGMYVQDKERQVTLGETNLEHIYPQNPEPASWGGPMNQEKLEPLTWCLGNLTIFGKRANRKAANEEFDKKLPRYRSSKVIMTQNIAQRYVHWDEGTILARARAIADLMVIIWNFDNPAYV